MGRRETLQVSNGYLRSGRRVPLHALPRAEHADHERRRQHELHTLDPRLAGITRNWVYTTLKKYGWSFKNVSHKQRLKFTSDNTSSAFARVLFCRVVAHRPAWHAAQVDEDLRVTLIKNIPLVRIKYLDEASFVSRGESEDGSCERESKSTTD